MTPLSTGEGSRGWTIRVGQCVPRMTNRKCSLGGLLSGNYTKKWTVKDLFSKKSIRIAVAIKKRSKLFAPYQTLYSFPGCPSPSSFCIVFHIVEVVL
jgi:hypothetical protein